MLLRRCMSHLGLTARRERTDMLTRNILTYSTLAWCFASVSKAEPRYPHVVPMERVIFVRNVENANVRVTINSTKGISVYKIQCHSSSYSADPDFNYSGDFECRMTSNEGGNTYSTLFTEDPNQSRDWESRARFFSSDLKGKCAQIPEFGSTRDFRLRGMKVTLQILNPIFDQSGSVRSLRLRIAARPDPSALGQIAAAVPLPASSPVQCKIGEYFVGFSASPKQ